MLYVYIYIYIYIEREREICIYTYLHIQIYTCTYNNRIVYILTHCRNIDRESYKATNIEMCTYSYTRIVYYRLDA